MKIRRINFWAGGGAGKTTTAARIFSELKVLDYKVELVSEVVKPWAWAGKVPKSFDQYFLHANQIMAEDQYLRHGCDLIVTDSPAPLAGIYAERYSSIPEIAEYMHNVSRVYEEKYPSLNFFLERGDKSYKADHGRYGTKESGMEMDKLILEYLDSEKIEYIHTSWKDRAFIINQITERLESCSE